MKMLALLIVLSFSGAAKAEPQREFTYDYTVPGKTKADLYKAAQSFLALTYGDNRAVIHSEDANEGTIIGKAIVPWNLSTGGFFVTAVACSSNYRIVFIAKEQKARLHLALVEGAPSRNCPGWIYPPEKDYAQLTQQFAAISQGLDTALRGESTLDRLKNF